MKFDKGGKVDNNALFIESCPKECISTEELQNAMQMHFDEIAETIQGIIDESNFYQRVGLMDKDRKRGKNGRNKKDSIL